MGEAQVRQSVAVPPLQLRQVELQFLQVLSFESPYWLLGQVDKHWFEVKNLGYWQVRQFEAPFPEQVRQVESQSLQSLSVESPYWFEGQFSSHLPKD